MLAQRLAGLLPAMTTEEALESAAVASLGGRFTLNHPPCARPARRTTRPARWRWWAAARLRAPVKYRWRTGGCCFSMSFQNFPALRSKPCANRWNPATSRFRRRAAGRVSGTLSAGCRHEPLPLRLFRLQPAHVPLLARSRVALSGKTQRTRCLTASICMWKSAVWPPTNW